MINSVESYAYRFILDHHISSFPVQFDTLVTAARTLGFKVRFYSQSEDALKQLGLQDMMEIYDAMTVDTPPLNYIFLDDKLSLERRRFALGHEIGHIVLNHTNYKILGKSPTGNKEAENLQEQEADSFSDYLLAPICVLKAAGIDSIRLIERKTALPENEAEHVFVCVHNHTGKFDALEKDVLNQFGINDQTAGGKKEKDSNIGPKILMACGAILIICALISGLLYLWDPQSIMSLLQ